MRQSKGLVMMSLLVVAALFLGAGMAPAQEQTTAKKPLADFLAEIAGRVKPSEQKAAAARQAAAIAAAKAKGQITPLAIPPGPGDVPDYFATPNWANSPALPKFVDNLPELWDPRGGGVAPAKCLPLAVPDITTYPGSDYYEIELNQYPEILHSTMPATTLRGYVQVNNGTNTAACGGVAQPACTPADNTVVPAPIRYLGPVIIATKDRPVRVKFINNLPLTAAGGNLFLPVDTSVMGSGDFEINFDPATMLPAGTNIGTFTQNRATLHLHGGRTPWISDGTPHQWITPKLEATTYPKGVSVQYVPDMWFDASGNTITACAGQTTCATPGASNNPGAGMSTFYWTNQQSSRLMFYHDHAWGITRLNVYAGEAAGYLITDPKEQELIAPTGLLNSVSLGVPLVVQFKTFVDANPASPTYVRSTDPTWAWGPGASPATGDLWWPHVYMPAQNPYNPDLSGVNAFGRWHYGPWFWPPTPVCGSDPQAVKPWCVTQGPISNPYYVSTCDPAVSGFCQPPYIPGTPTVSWGAEAFLDTPLVNGAVFPKYAVDPKAYRFRILNADHDKFLNLQLYKATPIVSSITIDNPGSGYESDPGVTISGGGGKGATATATVDLTPGSPTIGQIVSITLDTVGSGYTGIPTVTIDPPTALGGTTALGTAVVYSTLTEVGMVPAAKTPGFPSKWPTDGREGGVPDPAMSGPAFIQIGSEGGFLPAPVLLTNQPIAWNMDPTLFNVGNVLQVPDGGGTLILAPAERADVIVDFSQYAGQTLILYNDAPSAFPALDPHYDYYTGAPDRRDIGGAGPIPPGVGPNVRTIMQINVSGVAAPTTPVNAYDATLLTNLETAFKSTGSVATFDYTPGVFAAAQEPIIVGQTAYNSTYNLTFAPIAPYWGISNIFSTTLSFLQPDSLGNLATFTDFPMKPKAIHDEMGGTFDDFGRMAARLGLEVTNATPATSNFALQNYVDPPSELLDGEGVQIWKITHNGVDTHPIHYHLFDVQIINRVGWDGFIRMPDPSERGWKDTVRTSPLEDTIVALRPKTPVVPWSLPDSVRPLNPERPVDTGDDMGFSQIDPLTGGALAVTQTNVMHNYGWEYVWHCHILSHEENDMMRSIEFHVAPGAPIITSVIPGNGQADVYVTPFSTGGSPILFYTVTAFDAGIPVSTVSGPQSPITVPGLTNCRTYTFTVTATNAIGTGPVSLPSAGAIPGTVPAPPTMGLAVAGNATASVTFTGVTVAAGCNPILSYTVTSNPGGITAVVPGATPSPITVPVAPLVNGTTYVFTVTATNAVGTGSPSLTSNPVTPATGPGAPAITTVAPGNTQATVTFTAPASNGGVAISTYTVTATPPVGPPVVVTAPFGAITVTGLTNGVVYTFTVAATNAMGTGPASAPVVGLAPNLVARLQGTLFVGTYSTLQAAYNASASGDVIAMQTTTLTESPVFDLINNALNVNVVLNGGYDAAFSAQTGYTTLKGLLYISAGSAISNRVSIRP